MQEKPQKKLTKPKNATLNQKGKDKYQVSEKKKKALAKVTAAKERASQMFSAFPSAKMQPSVGTVDISSSEDDGDFEPRDEQANEPYMQKGQMFQQVKTQQSLIDSLKKQLESIKRK